MQLWQPQHLLLLSTLFFTKIDNQFLDCLQHTGRSGTWGKKSHQEGWQWLSDQLWACRNDFCWSELMMKPRPRSRCPLWALSSSVYTRGNWTQAKDTNFSTKAMSIGYTVSTFVQAPDKTFCCLKLEKWACPALITNHVKLTVTLLWAG